MNKQKNIHVVLDNQRLVDLLREQLKGQPDLRFDPDTPADLLVGEKFFRQEFKMPLRLGEVMDRFRYLLSGRDRFVEGGEAYDLGEFLLYADKNLLVHKQSSEKIRLTDKERLLLRTLCEAPSRCESREKLLDTVWGYARGTETHTLETHLYRLRQKLEPFEGQDLIQADGQGNYSLSK